ncbi:MAG: MoaD/ThiS family protein [Planctomycetaceae bacterium]|nr:MoaD/ThiS family protein [Planctomycetaceae bacterium]
MNILYINNNGGGFARQVYVDPGMTIADFFQHEKEGAPSNNSSIRVNGEIVTADYELQDGDKVTVTPTKMAGAR